METLVLNDQSTTYYNAHFMDLDDAIVDAKERSLELNITIHVIVSSNKYWVNSSPALQDWEKLYGTYHNGAQI